MNDLWIDLSRALPGLVPLLVAFIGALKPNESKSVRDQMVQEAAILKELPEGSPARKTLLNHLADQANRLKEERTLSRDWPMLVFALIGSAGLIYLTLWLWLLNAWWAYPLALATAILSTVFVYGVFETVQLKNREKPQKD